MGRPSSVTKLPPEVQAAIGSLRQRGHTIDEILAHLADMQSQVSRSALGRHVKGLDVIGERLRRSRMVAEALVHELGDAPESKAARLNIELMHNALLDLFMSDADGGDINELGKAALKGNPEGVMQLSRALADLARASKSNADFIEQTEKRAEKKALAAAAAAVDEVAKDTTAGLSVDTVAKIKAQIFGVAA